jgi:hypothetical protein
MAKRAPAQSGDPSRTVDQAIGNFAEDLGRILGHARSKAEGWLGQRNNIAKQLSDIRDTAADLLSQLTGGAARRANAFVRRKQRGQNPDSHPGTRKRKRRLSPAARKAISDAQKRRWAAVRARAKKS